MNGMLGHDDQELSHFDGQSLFNCFSILNIPWCCAVFLQATLGKIAVLMPGAPYFFHMQGLSLNSLEDMQSFSL